MKLTSLLIFGLIAGLAVGCAATGSSTNPATIATIFGRNVLAGDCDSPQAMQNFVNNLPPNMALNGTQELFVLQQVCMGAFGTAPAPTPAPGNQPAVPGAPTAMPTAAMAPGM